jgi:hypothetical protein
MRPCPSRRERLARELKFADGASAIYAVAMATARLPDRPPNGDWLVIAFAKLGCIPGFITHEEWDQESSPASFFEPIAKSMESLLYRIAEGRYIPTDYYAAKPFNDFLREENGA